MSSTTIPQPAEAARGVSPPVYTSLALLFSLLWATGFIAAEFGLRSSPPLFMMGLRFVLAGASLLLVMRLLGRVMPPRAGWPRLALLGLLSFAGFFGLTGIALQHVSAGSGAIVASTNPLLMALAAPILLAERLTRRQVGGMLVAFASVVVMMYSRTGIGDDPRYMLLLLLANVSMVSGNILFKRFALPYDLAVLTGAQLLAAGVMLLVPSVLLEPVASVRWDLNMLLSLAYQWFVLSWATMLLWLFLLRSGDASRANTFFFLNPVFGILLGFLILGEPLRPEDFLGTAGVALGLFLALRSR